MQLVLTVCWSYIVELSVIAMYCEAINDQLYSCDMLLLRNCQLPLT